MKTDPARKAWLASLKPGDIVAIASTIVGDTRDRETWVVDRIAERTIFIRQSALVQAVIRRTGYDAYAGTIEPASPREVAEHRRWELVDQIQRVRWSDVPTAALKRIVALTKPVSKRGAK